MMRRVTSHKYGLKELDLIRLTQALIISRLTYATPYLILIPRDKGKMNVIIRKAVKIALGLPPYTAKTKLLQLGKTQTTLTKSSSMTT